MIRAHDPAKLNCEFPFGQMRRQMRSERRWRLDLQFTPRLDDSTVKVQPNRPRHCTALSWCLATSPRR